MKNLIIGVISATLIYSTSVFADDNSRHASPYIGLEYKHHWMSGKNDWNEFVPDKFHNGGIFFGVKFHENWGAEIGHNQSIKRTDENTYNAGTTLFDATVPANGQIIAKTKVKVKNTYLDLIGHWEMAENWNILGAIGVGYTKARIQDNATSNNASVDANAASLQTANDVRNVNAKGKIVARAGLGIEYKYNHWKLRGKLLWEDTNRLRLKDTRVNVPSKYYKDSASLALGISYYFFD